jgi:hypothetical protein
MLGGTRRELRSSTLRKRNPAAWRVVFRESPAAWRGEWDLSCGAFVPRDCAHRAAHPKPSQCAPRMQPGETPAARAHECPCEERNGRGCRTPPQSHGRSMWRMGSSSLQIRHSAICTLPPITTCMHLRGTPTCNVQRTACLLELGRLDAAADHSRKRNGKHAWAVV